MTQDEIARFKDDFAREFDGYIDQTAAHIVELAKMTNSKPGLIMQFLGLAVQAKYHEGGKDDRDTK